MTALGAAVLAGLGVHLVWTALALGWTGLGLGPPAPAPRRRRSTSRVAEWLAQAGLDDVAPASFAAVTASIGAMSATFAYAVFGAALPALLVGGFGASFPVASYRNRRRKRRERAQEAWPRLIEEIRILTTSVGRSIPQAVFEAGRRGPEELQPAFDAAHREWLITTDFARTVAVLKARLADPTADAACETLLVAHEVGGADLDRRLEALAEDRIEDLHGRRDARARQAGVRFARAFVLVVPAGMALAGMTVGDGRAAYQEPGAQLIVAVAVLMVVACWAWAGRIMQIPEADRVFSS
jgi:tight adherence protein B